MRTDAHILHLTVADTSKGRWLYRAKCSCGQRIGRMDGIASEQLTRKQATALHRAHFDANEAEQAER